jgi:hypothetical protein
MYMEKMHEEIYHQEAAEAEEAARVLANLWP